MVVVTVMYHRCDGGTFDFDYYCNTHMKMVRERGAARVKAITVERGVRHPGHDQPYEVLGRVYFESMDDWRAVNREHGAKFVADLPNFSNIPPTIQVSEVVFEG